MTIIWKTARLGEVCQLIKRGISPKYTEADGISVINQKCIRDHRINLNLARKHDISNKKVNPERLVKFADVLVNSTGTGTLGRVAQFLSIDEEPITVDTHVTIVRPIEGIFHPAFFGYVMIFIEEQIIAGGEGASGQTELPRAKLENDFLITYPDSIDEQKRIVAILDEAFDGIDSSIANTEKNLANARELFESYLESIFRKENKGWFDTTIGDQLLLQRGFDITKKEQKPGIIPVVSSGGIKSYHDTAKVKEPGVAIGRKGSLGTVYFLDTEFWPHDTTLWVKDFFSNNPKFVYYFLKSINFKRFDSGTANPALNRNIVHFIPISWPEREMQEHLVDKFDSVFDESERLGSIYTRKLVLLMELKRTLLHKAFAGELMTAKVVKKELNEVAA